MDFKRFNGSTWETVRHKTYDTLAETLDRTENLYDPSDAPVAMYPNQSTGAVEAPTSGTITCSVIVQVEPNTEYTASFDTPSSGVRRRIGMYRQLPSVGLSAEAVDNTADVISGRSYNTFTTTANTAYILFMFYSKAASSGGSADEAKRIAKTITVRKGTSHVFVPYGFRLQASGEPLTNYTIYGNTGGVGDLDGNKYVIPVTSGGVTTNLYIDSPLGLTDTLTYTDTGIALPTVDGDNTITFGTSVQPSAMSATFKGWHAVQAAKTYDGNDWS